jgi:predicted nucleic acid-binding protein
MNPSPTSDLAEVVVIDTCVLSYISKPADPRCEPYRRHLEGRTVAISFITIGEIYAGIKKKGIGEKRQAEIEERIRAALVIPLDIKVCRFYAEICNLKTDAGTARTIQDNDRWIAACALAHGLRLVTHNNKHFAGIPGLKLITESDTLPLFEPDDNRAISL